MGRGRPKLEENPFAYRLVIRSFIAKHGEEKFLQFLKFGVNPSYTKSEVANLLGVGFGVVSRLYKIVFSIKKPRNEEEEATHSVKGKVRQFLRSFYAISID